MALTAGYEAVRETSRRYEARQSVMLEGLPSKSTSDLTLHPPDAHVHKDDPIERSSLLRPGNSIAAQERSTKSVKAVLYGIQVFYSFFIM